MTVVLSGGKILGSGAGVFSIGSGGTLAAPANVNMFNQGGPNVVTGNQNAAQTNVIAVQWDNVSGSTGFDVLQVNAQTGATSLVGSNVQPVTFTGTQSGTTLTVTGATAGTVLPGVRWSAAGLASGAMIDQPQLTGSGNGNGTYHMNTSQSLGPVTFTANLLVDSSATNATRPFFDAPTTGYWYQVATRNAGGAGSYSTNITMYQYQNGYSNVSNSDLSFGTGSANYASTNGSPISASGKCTEVVFTAYGFQPTAMAPGTPQWTAAIQWAGYFFIDINPGTNASANMYMGPPPCRTPEGDVFSWNNPQAVDLLSTSYGVTPVNNTWSRRKVPLALLAICSNSVTGSCITSTATVTAVGNDLFGNTGRVDNGGWITGDNITIPMWVHASGQSASIGTFTMYVGAGGNPPTSGTPANFTGNSTGNNWRFARYDEYKYAINPGGQPLSGSVYFGDWGFSRT